MGNAVEVTDSLQDLEGVRESTRITHQLTREACQKERARRHGRSHHHISAEHTEDASGLTNRQDLFHYLLFYTLLDTV